MTKVIIDTSIFEYAFVKPREREFLDLHQKANSWLRFLLDQDAHTNLMSSYQIAEVLEVFRRIGASEEARASLIGLIEDSVSKKALQYNLVKEAYMQSTRSNIHIYDYLVVLPFKGIVEEIYSSDQHFQHPDFTAVAPVINPLDNWITIEGRKPQKEKL